VFWWFGGRKERMSNARVLLEIKEVVSATRGGREVLAMWYNAEKGNPRRVLEPDRNPRTLVVIIHEEAINQFLGMAYYGGVLSRGGSECEGNGLHLGGTISSENTIDVAGFWRLRGFSRFLVVHLVLTLIWQCFGHFCEGHLEEV
jgi:hypothetical protein